MMMKKNYIVPGMFAMGMLVFAGCTGPTDNNVVTTDVTSPAVPATMNDAVESDDYVIDESDFVKGQGIIADIEAAELSEEEKMDLLYMREEEKLAHDVYLTLGEKWGQKIFTNIASSEKTHTESVKALLDRYNLVDSVTDHTVGVFTNPDLQTLYNDLVAQGSVSLVAALTVGATIEDLDIKDLQDAVARTDNADIIAVYENLLRGSRNHMRAFNRQLERNGATYEAQFLTQAEIDEILAGEQERGSGKGDGHGGGNGGGSGMGR